MVETVNGKFPLVLAALLISSTASLSAAPLTRPERDYIAMMTLSVGVTNMCDGYDVDDANVLRFADSRAINIKRLVARVIRIEGTVSSA
jgi:hypothetical protein